MNTKRMMRWVIVLFLLAVLPVMTAVMAQGQEPVAQELPVVTEPGESQAPETYNVYESEANNTRGTADPMNLGDVMGGKIGSAGDVDYFRFSPPGDGYVLIDIEAISIGSDLSAYVRLYNNVGDLLSYQDSLEPQDAMLFWVAETGDSPYYISVTDFYGDGGNSYNYELILSSPLLISAEAKNLGTGNVAGIPFQSQDILAWSHLNTGDEKWVMFFDGSDVGIKKNVTSIASFTGDKILLNLAANQTVPGAGAVTPWDIIVFDATRYGPSTAGAFSMGFPGRQHELTTSAEKIDALDWAGTEDIGGEYVGENYLLSTMGTATVSYYMGTFKPKDEDVFLWDALEGDYWWWLENSGVTGLPVEDVNGVTFGDAYDLIFLSILGNGNISGHNVTQKDIFALHYWGYGNYTWDSIVWHGPDHGWNYNIDAFEYPTN